MQQNTKPTFDTEEMVIQYLKQSPVWYSQFQSMDSDWKERFLDFCTGKKTLPMTYDPFFKKVFHPEIHPDRLSRFISSLLGKEVKVIRVLPTENTLMDGTSLVIMDILVLLADGSYANVEIQKVPYLFPAERMSCYSADLLLRQYSLVKGEKGKAFKYNDIKKVYTIVIFEKSTQLFHNIPEHYIHMGKTVFSTGLELELLQEYCLIALDVFRKTTYPKIRSEQTAWISLLAADTAADADKLVQEYPWLAEVYEEMAEFMYQPEEVLDMFSEALKILDRNTVQYMIEEQQEELARKDQQLEQKDQQLEQKDQQLEQKDQQLEQKDQQLEQKDQQLEQKDQQLEQKDQQLQDKDAEIARLQKLLAEKK